MFLLSIQVTQILLEAKACAMLCNVNGDTPMHLAVKFGHAEVVQCLMKLKKAKMPSQKSADASQVIKKPKKGFSTPSHSLHIPDEQTIDFHKSTPCLAPPQLKESHCQPSQFDGKNSSMTNLSILQTTSNTFTPEPKIQSGKGSRRNSRIPLDPIFKCSVL